MKFVKKLICCLLVLMSVITLSLTVNVKAESEVSLDGVEEMRGVWVSTVSLLDIKIRQGTTSENDILKWKTNFLNILDNVEKYKMNAVFFQVRPQNDAFYESKYNPWTSYLVGYGRTPGWDPMEWMINECHNRGIEFHAWLNPYRVGQTNAGINIYTAGEDAINKAKMDYAKSLQSTMTQTVDNPLFDFSDEQKFYDNFILPENGLLQMNPASEDVIEHIVNTVAEIASDYDVDGIHYDDYFYPSQDYDTYSEDRMYNSYKKSGGNLGLDDWRRDNVNRMVQRVDKAVDEVNKTMNKNVSFGISPSPYWAPNTESCTDGNRGIEGGQNLPCFVSSCYHDLYADTKKWVEEEWIDYILPQVYMNLDGHYPILVEWWANVVSGTKVKLYLGTGICEVVAGKYKQTEIADQMKWIRNNPTVKENVDGYVFFSYQSFTKASKTALMFVSQYFKTNAITPVSTLAANPGSELGKIGCIELTNKYSVSITEVEQAKGYLLYAFNEGEEQVYDKAHLVKVYSQTTGNNVHKYTSLDKTPKVYVLKTLNLNNEVISGSTTVSTKDASVNQAPVASFDFDLKEYYLMGEKVQIAVKATDDSASELDVTIYHALDGKTFRDATKMTETAPGVFTMTWEAFGLSADDNARFKVVINDGDKETEIISDYFKVLEEAPIEEYNVVFKDKDGNILKEEKVLAGEAATAPAVPEVPGYTFLAWDREFDKVTEDLVVTAVYEPATTTTPGKSGCKNDLALVVISLISLSTMALVVFKKEK